STMPHRAQRNLQFSATGYTEQRLRTPAVEPQHAFFTVVERDNNRQDPGKDLSNRMFEKSPQMQGLRGPSPDIPGNRPNCIQPHARSIGEITTFQTPS